MLFLLSNFFSMTVMICNDANKPSQVKKHRILLVLAVLHAIRLRELKFLSPKIMRRKNPRIIHDRGNIKVIDLVT